MDNSEILSFAFDDIYYKEIINFSRRVSELDADIIVLMARKAACLVRLLEETNLIVFDGLVISDRRLDMNLTFIKGKKVAIIDDVVVSGTTTYNTITKIIESGASDVSVHVLGINTLWFNPDLFNYVDFEGNIKSYLVAPFLKLTDAQCMQFCSNVVSCFALAAFPYDVDYPTYHAFRMSKNSFDKLVSYYDWDSYDVSSQMQHQNSTKTITLLPSEHILAVLDESLGFCISQFSFCKVRLFVKFPNKNKKTCIVNPVPYFAFNEINEESICILFAKIIENIDGEFTTLTKLRLLQYVISGVLFLIWQDAFIDLFGKSSTPDIDLHRFGLIFPKELYKNVKTIISKTRDQNTKLVRFNAELKGADDIFVDEKALLNIHGSDSIAILQARLVEPFTNLYKTKELESRKIVKQYGKAAFNDEQYKNLIGRLNIGYSYNFLKSIINDAAEFFNIDAVVSLFIDKAIDAGVIVPFIAYRKGMYFRAYRHGEDVPFGEKEEKLCEILLESYQQAGGSSALSEVRIEKMLALLLQIGIHQELFTQFASNTQNEDKLYIHSQYPGNNLHLPEKSMNLTAYIMGKVVTIDDVDESGNGKRKHYISSKNEAVWLSAVLKDKGIIVKDDANSYYNVVNKIDIDMDQNSISKTRIIGTVFGLLYKNHTEGRLPSTDDNDLVLFSSCLLPRDILSSLAAEIAIFIAQGRGYCEKCVNSVNDPIQCLANQEQYPNLSFYQCINNGQKKFLDFYNHIPYKRLQEIQGQFCADEKQYEFCRDLWTQFWPVGIDWDVNSIDKEMFNIIINEGKWLIHVNLLMRIYFYLCLNQYNIELRSGLIINHINQEVIMVKHNEWKSNILTYIQKLKVFKSDDLSERLSRYANSLLETTPSDKNTNTACILDVLRAIKYYTKTGVSIVDDSELIVNRFGQKNTIKRFSDALFIDIPNKDYTNIKQLLTQTFSRLLPKRDNGTSFLVIPNEHNRLSYGAWIIFSGKDASITAIEILRELLRNAEQKENITACLFLRLCDEHRIKTINECNTNIKYGCFGEYFESFEIFSKEDRLRNGIHVITEYVHKRSYELDALLGSIEFSGFKRTQDEMINVALKSTINSRKCWKIHMKAIATKTSEEAFDHVILVMVSTDAEEKAIVSKEKFIEKSLGNGFSCLMKNERNLTIILARGIEMGEVDAAIMAQDIIRLLKPKIIAMAGFCAGKRGEMTLGDVVIADKVFRYGVGKQTDKFSLLPTQTNFNLDGRIKQRVERFGDSWRESYNIIAPKDFDLQCYEFLLELRECESSAESSKVLNYEKYPNWTELITYLKTNRLVKLDKTHKNMSLTEKGYIKINDLSLSFPNGFLPAPPSTKVGVLATGIVVQQWDGIFDYLSKQYDRKCRVIDMEGHAMAKVAEFNNLKFFIVKGVGDFATDDKAFSNRFIEYAVYSSYRFIIEFWLKEENWSAVSNM